MNVCGAAEAPEEQGLCKTWTLDWTGLWTGLDYGLDWTGLTKTAVYRQQTPPRLQRLVPSSASSCFLAVESSRHRLLDFREVKGHVHI